MPRQKFQYSLWDLILLVASAALVLGLACGRMVRSVAAFAIAVLLGAALAWLGIVLLLEGAVAARRWAGLLVRLPFRARQLWFERRLGRLRPGAATQWVRSLLGVPRRVDGFGDRLYWSYRVAGHRYTVALDPRKLVATYSNGLARDPPKRSVRIATPRVI